jgi:hypothetical protein
MRTEHNPNLVAFRAGDRLVAALQERAKASGVSVSEYLRTIAREKVGLQ